ncbi:hypothetical protein TRFO_38441 [Tritrichomonas foetus]|uniref:TNase-like domain-containing protein n=1 Tax=Tritrichomonas foetus TaxID=1144522 RepID=A0A1J4JDX8_9EUKA|nr:hypothetical protein TRFO_38441 [Tritrichomonas foetus]|eukprot:OHS95460.1 hypothetical protein TRFO_38441 [Tritrichomonas foetus]
MQRGFVVAVLSGDTLAVKLVGAKNTPIHAVCVEFIQAPRLGSYDGRNPDEPHAWDSFEFVRNLCIGQRVVLNNLRTPDNLNKRSNPVFGPLPVSFAQIELFDKDHLDLGTAIIENGWGSLRVLKNQDTEDDYKIRLTTAQDEAKEAKKGIWAENGRVRKLPVDWEPNKLLKIKEFDAMIDNVISGSAFSAFLLPNFEQIRIQLAGIRTPGAKRDAPEPFGLEAKHFSEQRLLQRHVKVQLFSFNDQNNFFSGRVLHPNGDISIFLLNEGLAQMNNMTASQVNNSGELRQAESRAKEARKNLWKNFDVKTLRSIRFDGRVVLVKGSSSIEVESGSEIRRLWLSGCRIPNFNATGNSEPYGLEAREKLRNMLIGRNVQCMIDYKVEDRPYATVYTGNTCVNEAMAAAGLCNVFVAKNQNPSERIDAMMHAEQEAKAKKLGIHGIANPAVVQTQLNDLSNKHSRQRSVPFLHYIQNKVNKGVIEHFVSATRVVVLIPSERCVIRVNLQGVLAADPKDRLGFEALEYCNSNFLQRDCEVQVFDVDKVGVYIGNVRLIEGKKSLEEEILSRGFTEIHTMSVSRCPYKRELEAAQKSAEDQKIGVWSNRIRGTKLIEPGKAYEVNIVDIWDPATVVVQLQSDELKKINQGLLQVRQEAGKVMKGDFVAAVWEGKIYRAKVERVKNEETAEIEFLELGIHDEIPIKDLRVLPQQLIAIPPQAVPVRLAGLKAFHFDDEFNESGNQYIWDNCENATLYAHLVSEDDMPSVLLTDGTEPTSGSLNTQLLAEGYVRAYLYDVNAPFDKVFEELDETEKLAKAEKKGAWVHGNIGDDEDEDEAY